MPGKRAVQPEEESTSNNGTPLRSEETISSDSTGRKPVSTKAFSLSSEMNDGKASGSFVHGAFGVKAEKNANRYCSEYRLCTGQTEGHFEKCRSLSLNIFRFFGSSICHGFVTTVLQALCDVFVNFPVFHISSTIRHPTRR